MNGNNSRAPGRSLRTQSKKISFRGNTDTKMLDPILVRSVEYPITEHCNLRCIHCDHASPLLPHRFIDPDQYHRDLEAIAPALHTQEFNVLGGEPLLHPELLELLSLTRTSGVTDSITVVTNGTLLHKAPAQMWKLIDKLWLSVYPNVNIRLSLEAIRQLCIENSVLLYVRRTSSFGQRLIDLKNDDSRCVQWIYDRCKLAHEWRCYSIYAGRFYKCSPAPFTQHRLAMRGIVFDGRTDGISLHGNRALRDDLENYLRSMRPLAACSYCLGTSGFDVPLRQLKRDELLEGSPPKVSIETLINKSR